MSVALVISLISYPISQMRFGDKKVINDFFNSLELDKGKGIINDNIILNHF